MTNEGIIIAAIGAIPSTVAAIYANKAHRTSRGNRQFVENQVKPQLDDIDKAVNQQAEDEPTIKEQMNDVHSILKLANNKSEEAREESSHADT